MNHGMQGQAVADGDSSGTPVAADAAQRAGGNPGHAEAAGTAVAPPSAARARALAILSILLGGAAFVARPTPLPSAFPWLTLVLALAALCSAVGALRARPRGRIAVVLALLGLVASLSFPALVVFVFARYFNWNG
jgi:hypothetical protein